MRSCTNSCTGHVLIPAWGVLSLHTHAFGAACGARGFHRLAGSSHSQCGSYKGSSPRDSYGIRSNHLAVQIAVFSLHMGPVWSLGAASGKDLCIRLVLCAVSVQVLSCNNVPFSLFKAVVVMPACMLGLGLCSGTSLCLDSCCCVQVCL